MTTVDISKLEREELTLKLNEILDILITIGEKMKLIDDLNNQIKKEESNAEKQEHKLTEKIQKIWWICIIICVVIGLFAGNGILFVLFLGGLGGWFSYYVLDGIDSILHADQKHIAVEEYTLLHVNPLKEQLNEHLRDTENFMNSENVISAENALPEKYFDIGIIICLIDYLECRRADSFKEAINLYEEEKHRLKMEEMQQSILDATERQSEILKDIEQNSANAAKSAKSAARTAKIGAVINYATYSNIKKMRKN